MADSNSGDVERHYSDLFKQLQEDGFDEDSSVMKTAVRLRAALLGDGFAFAEAADSAASAEEESVVDVSTEVVAEPEEVPVVSSSPEVVRAFRVRDVFDAKVVTSVFAPIKGWKTRVLDAKGSHFVIATNAKDLSNDLIRQAVVEYTNGLKQVSK